MLDQFQNQATEATRGTKHSHRGLRRALIAVVALMGLLAVGVFGYGVYLNETVTGNITHADLLPDPSTGSGGGAQPGEDGEDGEPGDKDDPGTKDEGGNGNVKDEPNFDPRTVPTDTGQNFLLIGSDARPGETASRSDVIILAHVTEAKDKVYLVHFPRDLYVDVPGHGKTKINAAYAYGGAPLLVTTLQNLIHVRVDHVLKMDFEGFRAMTDAVGGVRVYAEEASNGSGNGGPVVIHEGWNHLNGTEALAFVRERYLLSEGDISRGRRQQAFLRALMVETLSVETVTNPVRLANFIDAATANTVVDQTFDIGEMRQQAISMAGLRGDDVVFITAPFSGFGTSPVGGSIDIVDEVRMAQLGDAVRYDSLGEYVAGGG